MQKPSKFVISLVSAAVLGVVALTGCGGGNSEPSDNGSGEPSVASTNGASEAPTNDGAGKPGDLQTGETVDKDKFSADLTAAMEDIKSYEAVTSLTMDMDGTALTVEGLMQVDGSDEDNPKIYTKSTNSVSGTSETIMIGNTMYMRSGDQELWTKDTIDEEQKAEQAEAGLDETDSLADGATSISYAGEATVNGEPAHKYELTDEQGETMFVYIDNDHRMVKVEFAGESSMSATYSKFNEKFDITEPPADQVAS